MKNLTARYSGTHFFYWTAYSATSFAAAYLLEKGMNAGTIGLLLGLAGLGSCLTQPILASLADRAKGSVLITMMLALSAVCAAFLGAQLVPGIPVLALGIIYVGAIWIGDAMMPLLNALSIAYPQAGYPMNFGVARGVGAVASALSALALGYVMNRFGAVWLLAVLIGARLVDMVLLAGFPKLQTAQKETEKKQTGISVGAFFGRYKWFCGVLVGVLLLSMDHAMTENYLIAILTRLGGNSSHVGVAIFICSMVAAVVITCFSMVRKLFSDAMLMKIAGVTYVVRSVGMYFAPSITSIYLLQLLQLSSYCFLIPTLVYFAGDRIESQDMVKGQAFATAAYALGVSAGNYAGGLLLNFGVDTMLLAGIGMAVAGLMVILLTVDHRDAVEEKI